MEGLCQTVSLAPIVSSYIVVEGIAAVFHSISAVNM